MRLLTAVVSGLVLLAQPAVSQTYPSKPIHMLVPYAPGGITDIAARIVGAKLTEAWGQQVVVENRPGGNGFIAMSAGAKAAPDGYTLTMATVGDVSINPALFKDMPYKWERFRADQPRSATRRWCWRPTPTRRSRAVADVLAAAKAQPGRISVGSPGNGSINQIVIEWMALNTGTQFQHIPYKGGAPEAAALAGGDIPFGVLASSSVAPQVKAGRRARAGRDRRASPRSSIRNGRPCSRRASRTSMPRTGRCCWRPRARRRRSSTSSRPRW